MADFSFIPAYLTRILTLGYFLFIAPAVCFAQHPVNKHIDSLLAILPPAHDDTNKVNILCKLANLYPDYDPNKGLEIAKQSWQLSEKLHWDEGIIHSLISAGLNECSRTAYLSALKYFENARDKATEITNKSLVGVATEHCGIAYYDQNNYPEALRLFFDALQVSEELHNPKQQYMILEYIGKIYEAQRQYDKALDFYKRSYDKALKAGETKAKTKNLINIGQVYQEMGRYNEALTCFSESIVTFTAQHDEGGVAVSLANMGAINQQLHKYGVALQMEFDALHIYEKYADRMNIASVCANIGRIYLVALTDTTGAIIPDSLRNRKTNIRKGFYYLHKSEELCKNLSFLDGLYTTYADLSFAYELNGNFQAALDAYKGN
jgi:tetratricopeptide (TPR) repeat protein